MKTKTETQVTGHWKKLFDPNFLGSWDLEENDLIVTVKSVTFEKMHDVQNKTEIEKPVINFLEDVKPFVLNPTNARTIERVMKSPRVENWKGNKIQLFKTQVKAFGGMVDAIRVRDFAPKGRKSLTEGRFLKMLVSIRDGKFPKERAFEFDLTPEQKSQINAL